MTFVSFMIHCVHLTRGCSHVVDHRVVVVTPGLGAPLVVVASPIHVDVDRDPPYVTVGGTCKV